MPDNNEQLIPLSSMTLGQKAQIVAYSFETEKGERVLEMDFSPGEYLEIVRSLTLTDPIEIKIRGYFFSLSKDEADHIKVKLVS